MNSLLPFGQKDECERFALTVAMECAKYPDSNTSPVTIHVSDQTEASLKTYIKWAMTHGFKGWMEICYRFFDATDVKEMYLRIQRAPPPFAESIATASKTEEKVDTKKRQRVDLVDDEDSVYYGSIENRRRQALKLAQEGKWQRDPMCGCNIQHCPLCEVPE